MPGKPSQRYPTFIARLGEYVEAAAPGSLVGRFAEAPADADTKPVGQIPHWLFATGDTLAINAFRALAPAREPRRRSASGRSTTSDARRLPRGGDAAVADDDDALAGDASPTPSGAARRCPPEPRC